MGYWNCNVPLFWGIVVGRFTWGKRGENRMKKLFTNISVEALIPFNVQGLFILQVPLGW